MDYKVFFLHQAELDLKELKDYLLKNFSNRFWQSTYKKIKETINNIKGFPEVGCIPPELENLNLYQYRQVISGMNRIIYEIKKEMIYIHIICDVRREMKSLLSRRLLRTTLPISLLTT